MAEQKALVDDCRRRIERGSKSFAIAARLFAPEVRESAYMLYAWCRYCDDVIDGQHFGFVKDGDRDDPRERLSYIENQTQKSLQGVRASEIVFQALGSVCRKNAIPHQYPLDLIAGFKMDVEGRQYQTFFDTLEYCYHVAGCVGVMMAYVMGARERTVLDRACDLGIAFQLTNIARDVAADHQMGRVYLPSDWLHAEGLSADDMFDASNKDQLFRVVSRLLEAAEPYYKSADAGIVHLPWRSAWAVASAKSVYRAIGTEVLRKGATAWGERASTGIATKLGGVAGGLVQTVASRGKVRIQGASHDRAGLWTMDNAKID